MEIDGPHTERCVGTVPASRSTPGGIESVDGTPIEYQNFRSRVFNRIVRKTFGASRRVTPHMLRHTFASLHLARGTNLKWVQETGAWTSAKMLLDVYGHFMPTENTGYADAITAANGTTA